MFVINGTFLWTTFRALLPLEMNVVWVSFLSGLASFLVFQHRPLYQCLAMHVPSAQQRCLQPIASPLEYGPHHVPTTHPFSHCLYTREQLLSVSGNRHPLTPSSPLACVVCGSVSTYHCSGAAEEKGENRHKRSPSSTALRSALQGQRRK